MTSQQHRSQTPEPTDAEEAANRAGFEALKQQAAAAGIPQDGPIGGAAMDFIRARAGDTTQNPGESKA